MDDGGTVEHSLSLPRSEAQVIRPIIASERRCIGTCIGSAALQDTHEVHHCSR